MKKDEKRTRAVRCPLQFAVPAFIRASCKAANSWQCSIYPDVNRMPSTESTVLVNIAALKLDFLKHFNWLQVDLLVSTCPLAPHWSLGDSSAHCEALPGSDHWAHETNTCSTFFKSSNGSGFLKTTALLQALQGVSQSAFQRQAPGIEPHGRTRELNCLAHL